MLTWISLTSRHTDWLKSSAATTSTLRYKVSIGCSVCRVQLVTGTRHQASASSFVSDSNTRPYHLERPFLSAVSPLVSTRVKSYSRVNLLQRSRPVPGQCVGGCVPQSASTSCRNHMGAWCCSAHSMSLEVPTVCTRGTPAVRVSNLRRKRSASESAVIWASGYSR